MLTDERRYTAEEALEIADRAVLESMLEEGCSWADAIRAKIREAFALPPWRYTEEDMNAERVRVQEETEAEVLARVEVPPEVVAIVKAAVEWRQGDGSNCPTDPSRSAHREAAAIDALLAAYPDGTWRQAIGGVQPEPVEVQMVQDDDGRWGVHVIGRWRALWFGHYKRPMKAAALAVWLRTLLQHFGVPATLREEGE